jgi:hypothetical protein
MKVTSDMLKVPILTQKTDHDCGITCVEMILAYFNINNRGISSLSSIIDGLQVRTIESYFREKGCNVISGNMNIETLRYFIRNKTPVITLLDNHYIIIKGFANRKIIYNDPESGEVYESLAKFKKRWWNISDGSTLVAWGIAIRI